VEEAAQAPEAIVAQRRGAGQPSSHYVGVTWAKTKRLLAQSGACVAVWKAQIGHEGRKQNLGYFDEEDGVTCRGSCWGDKVVGYASVVN